MGTIFWRPLENKLNLNVESRDQNQGFWKASQPSFDPRISASPKKGVGGLHAGRQLTIEASTASTNKTIAVHSGRAVRSQTMNLISSSGSDLVEDDDDDDAMDYQRHALGAAAIGMENDRSRRDRIARLCTSSFASRVL